MLDEVVSFGLALLLAAVLGSLAFQRPHWLRLLTSLYLGWLQLFDLHVQRFVDRECSGLTETFSALLTFEWLLFRVDVPAHRGRRR